MTEKERNRPLVKWTRGSVQAGVFENRGKDGRVWHNVSIIRRYKAADGSYRDASTYAVADLVQVVKLAEQAEAWIAERMTQLDAAPTSNVVEII